MTKITTVNWDKFKYKFSGNPQDPFEDLSYHIICSIYKQEQGIFRYFNQSAIETIPFESNGDTVVWQAKFYTDTKISDNKNKNEIIKSIKNAKKKWPNITKYYLFSNKEFSEHHNKEYPSDNKPSSQIEIEEVANSLGIVIEWFLSSNFESLAINSDFFYVFEYYFSTDFGVIEFARKKGIDSKKEINVTTESILFNNKNISVERTTYKERIKDEDNKFIFICGEGGSGKSSLIKDCFSNDSNFYYTNIQDFAPSYFNNITIEEFSSIHEINKEKTFIIDSFEDIELSNNNNKIFNIIKDLLDYKWKIIILSRNSIPFDLQNICSSKNITITSIIVPYLKMNELELLSEKNNFNLPSSRSFKYALICLFNLKIYLQNYNSVSQIDIYNDFEAFLKNTKFRNTSSFQLFISMVKEKNNQNSRFFNSKANGHALEKLIHDEIIKYDEDRGYSISHDLYEEFALSKSLSQDFFQNNNTLDIINSFRPTFCIIKSFKLFLERNIDDYDVEVHIKNILTDYRITDDWKNIAIKTIVSINPEYLFNKFSNEIISSPKIFTLIVDSYKLFWTKNSNHKENNLLFRAPVKINRWEEIIDFVFINLKQFKKNNINNIINIIENWSFFNKTGELTIKSSIIALHLYENNYDINCAYKITPIIFFGANDKKVSIRIKSILDEVLISDSDRLNENKHSVFCRVFLKNTLGHNAYIDLMNYYFKVARKFWFQQGTVNSGLYVTELDMYGFDPYDLRDLNSDSFIANKEIISKCLSINMTETISFILDLINKITLNFHKNNKDSKKIIINKKDLIINYYGNQMVWDLGFLKNNKINPICFCLSALDDLFTALIKYVKDEKKDITPLKEIIEQMAEESNSLIMLSFVSGLVIKNPTDFFDIAKMLLRNPLLLVYDRSRMYYENSEQSNLEYLIYSYQFLPSYRECIFKIIDDYKIEQVPILNQQDFNKFINRIDTRIINTHEQIALQKHSFSILNKKSNLIRLFNDIKTSLSTGDILHDFNLPLAIEFIEVDIINELNLSKSIFCIYLLEHCFNDLTSEQIEKFSEIFKAKIKNIAESKFRNIDYNIDNDLSVCYIPNVSSKLIKTKDILEDYLRQILEKNTYIISLILLRRNINILNNNQYDLINSILLKNVENKLSITSCYNYLIFNLRNIETASINNYVVLELIKQIESAVYIFDVEDSIFLLIEYLFNLDKKMQHIIIERIINIKQDDFCLSFMSEIINNQFKHKRFSEFKSIWIMISEVILLKNECSNEKLNILLFGTIKEDIYNYNGFLYEKDSSAGFIKNIVSNVISRFNVNNSIILHSFSLMINKSDLFSLKESISIINNLTQSELNLSEDNTIELIYNLELFVSTSLEEKTSINDFSEILLFMQKHNSRYAAASLL